MHTRSETDCSVSWCGWLLCSCYTSKNLDQFSTDFQNYYRLLLSIVMATSRCSAEAVLGPKNLNPPENKTFDYSLSGLHGHICQFHIGCYSYVNTTLKIGVRAPEVEVITPPMMMQKTVIKTAGTFDENEPLLVRHGHEVNTSINVVKIGCNPTKVHPRSHNTTLLHFLVQGLQDHHPA